MNLKNEVDYFDDPPPMEVKPGQIFVQKSNDLFFTVLHVANTSNNRPEGIPVIVVYQGIDGHVHTRTIESFRSKMRPFIRRT